MTATVEDAAEVVDVVAGPPHDEPGPGGRRPLLPVPDSLRGWHDPDPLRGWVWTGVVAVVALLTRFWSLSFPPTKSFDEVYYATEAQELLRYGYEDNRGYMFVVHPPLGKWLIAGSSAIWGDNSLGWRVAPALAGTIAVVLLARTARTMFRSNLFGALAGLLLAVDGLSIVLSRVALLDIFLELFVLAAFAALVADRRQFRARLAALLAHGVDLSTSVPPMGPRPYRLLAGVMFAAALAVKWSALSFWIAFCLLSLIWDFNALKAAGNGTRFAETARTTLRRSVPGAAFSFLVVTVGMYLFCWLGWFAGNNSWNRHWADTHGPSTHLDLLGVHVPFWWGWVPDPIRSLAAYTLNAYRFHESLAAPHPYQSNPWSWLVLGRPVNLYFNQDSHACGAQVCTRQILMIGTPFLWWAFVPALLWGLWHLATTRDWRATVPWVGMLAGWFVWFQDPKRTMFLFYMAPLVPFLILAVTLGLGVMLGRSVPERAPPAVIAYADRRRRWGVIGVAAYLGLVLADAAWMWPLWTAGLRTYEVWHLHMWFPSWV